MTGKIIRKILITPIFSFNENHSFGEMFKSWKNNRQQKKKTRKVIKKEYSFCMICFKELNNLKRVQEMCNVCHSINHGKFIKPFFFNTHIRKTYKI